MREWERERERERVMCEAETAAAAPSFSSFTTNFDCHHLRPSYSEPVFVYLADDEFSSFRQELQFSSQEVKKISSCVDFGVFRRDVCPVFEPTFQAFRNFDRSNRCLATSPTVTINGWRLGPRESRLRVHRVETRRPLGPNVRPLVQHRHVFRRGDVPV